MVAKHLSGLCILLLAGGCAYTPEQPPLREPQPAATVPDTSVPVQPPKTDALPTEPPAAPREAERAPETTAEALPKLPEARAPSEVAAPKPDTPKVAAAPATSKPPAKTERPAAPQAAPKKPAAAPAAVAPQPPEPTLDLKSLENRLRETNAIGLMTKLTLKGQVEDLLDRFRAYHDGKARIPLAELRQPYDTLILKVLALLQDKDPPLAGAIASSREAIWAILADRAKFLKL